MLSVCFQLEWSYLIWFYFFLLNGMYFANILKGDQYTPETDLAAGIMLVCVER